MSIASPELAPTSKPKLRTIPASILVSILHDGRRTLALLGALVLASIAAQVFSPLNHDAAYYLHSAKDLLEGRELYNDLYFDMNPPLAMFFSLPAVLLSELTGLFPVDAYRVCLFGWILFSSWLAWRLMDGLLPEPARRGLMVFVLIAVCLAPLDHFGQREHYLMVALLPYLALAARRAERLPVSLLGAAFIGAHAAPGLSLKPYFLLVPAIIEIYLFLRHRNLRKLFRPETLGLGFAVLIYLLFIVFYTPAYFTVVIPMAAEIYDKLNIPFLDILFISESPILAAALFIYLRRRGTLNKTGLPDILCLATVGLFAAFLLQMKGWAYHLYPTVACLIMFLGAYIVLDIPSGAPAAAAQEAAPRQDRWTRRLAVATCLVLCLTTAAVGTRNIKSQLAYLNLMVPFVRQYSDNAPFHVFTTNLSAAFPLVNYAEVEWGSRFAILWPVVDLGRRHMGALEYESDAQRKSIESYKKFFIDAIVADLARWRPQIVLVDERTRKPFFDELDFDYIEFFSTEPRFKKLWADYELMFDLGGFTVYTRADKADGAP